MADTWKRLDGIEQEITLSGIADVSLNKLRVHLRVDILHRNLKAVEATSFCDLK